MSDLKEKINAEMLSNYSNILERLFERAKRFISVTSEGKVHLLVNNEVRGEDKICLYLIGKLYAKEGGLSKDDAVTNFELSQELNIPEGGMRGWLSTLFKKGFVEKKSAGVHKIKSNRIESVLDSVEVSVGVSHG